MNNNNDKYTENYMVTFDIARKLIDKFSTKIDSEHVPLNKASNRVLAEDIVSPISVPTFNNSAMDGYAVNCSDLLEATKDKPVSLMLAGVTAAGDNIAKIKDPQKTAWKIMTGAPVPNGYDSIIPVENTKLEDEAIEQNVLCFSSPKSGAHIRSSGEDFKKGMIVLKKNIRLNANRIMALSSLGIGQVLVKCMPKISVFSTGKELVDDLSQALNPGQIYNSNMPYILEYLKSLPVLVKNAGTNLDDAKLYQSKLHKELDEGAQIIISTGAVSMGDFDFIPQTIIKMGGEIIFHKVKIKPGKPFLFAKFPNGTFYIGLPGNPISATIGLRFFATHLVMMMLDLKKEIPSKAQLNNDGIKNKGFMAILKASTSISNNANIEARIMQGQESFKINPLVDSNAWVVLSEELDLVKKSTLVNFYPSEIAFA